MGKRNTAEQSVKNISLTPRLFQTPCRRIVPKVSAYCFTIKVVVWVVKTVGGWIHDEKSYFSTGGYRLHGSRVYLAPLMSPDAPGWVLLFLLALFSRCRLIRACGWTMQTQCVRAVMRHADNKMENWHKDRLWCILHSPSHRHLESLVEDHQAGPRGRGCILRIGMKIKFGVVILLLLAT